MVAEEMKPLAAARREVLSTMRLLPTLEVPLEQAQGLALVSDVVAPHPVPHFANSAMDGYAVRVADVADPPVVLRITEDVPAGRVATRLGGSGNGYQDHDPERRSHLARRRW